MNIAEANPVYRRESRVLWRGDRPFLLLFFHAVALAFAALSAYSRSGVGNSDLVTHNLNAGGRAMFQALSEMQLDISLLVVPILAAPTIAFERERGLLEALHLTGVTSRSIVVGKLGGVLIFAMMLLAASAPPLSICFLMGGVAPGEFLKALALQGVTIFSSAALGLYLSSRARRPPQALRNVFLALFAWLGFSYGGGDWLRDVSQQLNSAGWNQNWINSLSGYCIWLPLFNPLMILKAVFDPNYMTTQGYYFIPGYSVLGKLTGGRIGPPWLALPYLRWHLVLQMGAALWLLWRAEINTRRTFASAQWLERKKHLTLREGRLSWREDTTQAAAPKVAVSATAEPRAATRATLDTPLVALIKFSNPVLQREVRSRLRMRRFSNPIMALVGVAGVGALLFYTWLLMWIWLEPNARGTFWNVGAMLLLLAAMTLLPLAGAGGIARERESGSWESLQLSLLSARQIVWGKAIAPLLVLAGAIGVLAPVWVPCVNWFQLPTNFDLVVPLLNALAMLALIFCTAFNYNAWGLWISWRCRSTAAATGWTLGTLFLSMTVLPIVLSHVTQLFYALYSSYFDGSMANNELYGAGNAAYGVIRALNPWEMGQSLLVQAPTYYGRTAQRNFTSNEEFSYALWLLAVANAIGALLGAGLLCDLERRMEKLRSIPARKLFNSRRDEAIKRDVDDN